MCIIIRRVLDDLCHNRVHQFRHLLSKLVLTLLVFVVLLEEIEVDVPPELAGHDDELVELAEHYAELLRKEGLGSVHIEHRCGSRERSYTRSLLFLATENDLASLWLGQARYDAHVQV